LNITDEVIRFLITKPDLKAIAKAESHEGRQGQEGSRARRGWRRED